MGERVGTLKLLLDPMSTQLKICFRSSGPQSRYLKEMDGPRPIQQWLKPNQFIEMAIFILPILKYFVRPHFDFPSHNSGS